MLERKVGDVVKNRIVESERPDLDAARAAATRRTFLERSGGRDVLVGAPPFPSPSLGRVVRDGDALWFSFETA